MRKEFVATGKTLDEAMANVCLMANTTIDNLDIDVLEAGKSGFLGFGRRDYKVVAYMEVPDTERTPEKSTTFGKKKTKREKFEEKTAKEAKKGRDMEIRPIVTAEPDPKKSLEIEEHRQFRPRRDRRPRPERPERPERIERPERPERTERVEKNDLERSERERRHESHALIITEGELADRLYDDACAFLLPVFAKLGVQPEITHQVREGILWLNLSGDNLGILIGRRGETLNALQYLVNLSVNKRRHEHARLVLDVSGYRESREETLTALARKMAEKAVRSGRRVELEPMNPHERRVVHIALQEDKRVDTLSHGEEPYRRVVISPKNRRPRNRKQYAAPNPQQLTEEDMTLVMPSDAAAPEVVETLSAAPADAHNSNETPGKALTSDESPVEE